MQKIRPLAWLLPASLLFTLPFLPLPTARALETDLTIHDPSTVVKSGRTYWVYGTGAGVPQFSSTDRVHWTFRGPAFSNTPAWVASAVPANRGNDAWAPDIHFFQGLWHLYYSYSSFSSNVSGIGVATNKTLDPKGWEDQGLVIRTSRDTNFNAIDPCIFQDAAGRPWLSFGSFFGGIKLVALDPATGKPAAGGAVFSIATRPHTPPNAIEASCVFYHAGYYYSFVNWDACCAGPRSTYNVRVGRSHAVTGPYLDKAGRDMQEGGGTLFLGSAADNGTGRPVDDEVGPGHVGILEDAGDTYISYHNEWARDRGGRPTLNLNKLAWDGDGWPRPVLDPGPYSLVSALATHDVVTATMGAAARMDPPDVGPGQRWRLSYLGDGFYRLMNGAGGVLSVTGDAAKPGAQVQAVRDKGRSGQRWFLQQNDDGTWTLLPKSGGKALALDVTGCSLSDGAALEQWAANGLDCQKWSFHTR